MTSGGCSWVPDRPRRRPCDRRHLSGGDRRHDRRPAREPGGSAGPGAVSGRKLPVLRPGGRRLGNGRDIRLPGSLRGRTDVGVRPTFAYEFNDENAPQNFLPAVSFPYGSAHASEIQYIFPVRQPVATGLKLPQTPLNANQQQLSDKMVGYWTEFAESGNPNAIARRTGRASIANAR